MPFDLVTISLPVDNYAYLLRLPDQRQGRS